MRSTHQERLLPWRNSRFTEKARKCVNEVKIERIEVSFCFSSTFFLSKIIAKKNKKIKLCPSFASTHMCYSFEWKWKEKKRKKKKMSERGREWSTVGGRKQGRQRQREDEQMD